MALPFRNYRYAASQSQLPTGALGSEGADVRTLPTVGETFSEPVRYWVAGRLISSTWLVVRLPGFWRKSTDGR